jgi:prophage lambdaBa02, site-specific recombinase, phage integrase family
MKTEYLLNKELEHVLAALTPLNRLACRVALHTGLRISDVLALKTDKLAGRFTVVEGKTGKKKVVGLPADLLRELKASAGETFVFEHRLDRKRHRTRQAVFYDIKRAAKAFRLKQNIGPHSLRKVYAVDLLNKYGDIERVKRALNHSGLSVTMIYAMADKLLEAKQKRRAQGQKKRHS